MDEETKATTIEKWLQNIDKPVAIKKGTKEGRTNYAKLRNERNNIRIDAVW